MYGLFDDTDEEDELVPRVKYSVILQKEDYEDDDQEEVYDRESVKKYSFLMLEKANKKQKRQKKKKIGKAEAAAAVPSPTKYALSAPYALYCEPRLNTTAI